MQEQNRPEAPSKEKWRNFQYMIAHCYAGSIHPKKLCVCFADADAFQDVVVSLLLDYGSYVALAISATFECGEFEEAVEYDMVSTKENAAEHRDLTAPATESTYCGLAGCEKHGGCPGPRDCFLWRDFQYLVAHTSPVVENGHDLNITYYAREYDGYSNALFSRHMGTLVYCIQAVFEHYEEIGKVSVHLSSQ